ncbi:MAG: SH3 domain-containing protein [Novosphingobium sp.]
MELATGLSAPIFVFGGSRPLPDTDLHLRELLPTGPFTLSGPGATAEAGHLPVRGDLAHIKLAGRYFVPHYAVPMPRKLAAEAPLRKTGRTDGDVIETLSPGTLFNVLDIAGGWAWGQVGEDGFVGYLPIDALEAE